MEEFYSFRKNSRKNYLLITIVAILVIGLIVIVGVHFFRNDNGTITNNIVTTSLTDTEAKMFRRVSETVVGIGNELPKMERITELNIEQIKTNNNLEVKLGDELLTYSLANVVIVYRPIEEKVVWVLPQ